MSPVVADDYTLRLRRRRPRRPRAEHVDTAERTPRRGAKRRVSGVIRQLPHFGRMILGLLGDRRVNTADKVVLGAVLAYMILPFDFIPDAIPFLGQVDDVYLLMLGVQRLLSGAGPRLLRKHWTGDPRDLRALDVEAVVSSAAFFLPRRMRRGLRGLLR